MLVDKAFLTDSINQVQKMIDDQGKCHADAYSGSKNMKPLKQKRLGIQTIETSG